jgi:hypothetical protein
VNICTMYIREQALTSCISITPYDRPCYALHTLCIRVRVTLRLTVSQSVSQSSPLCGRLTRYYFLFKSSGLEFVVLSLWSALSDERPGLSFVIHSVCVKL